MSTTILGLRCNIFTTFVATILVTATLAGGSAATAATDPLPIATFSVNPFEANLQYDASVDLGTATITESAPGTVFSSTPFTVSLGLADAGDATFNVGDVPTIVTSAGTTASAPTMSTTTITFDVTTSPNAVAAKIDISGMRLYASGSTQLRLTTNVPTGGSVKALNVINFSRSNREESRDRYETAAFAFSGIYPGDIVVLSSGETFADALSANYLAGQLGAGILLTTSKSLPAVTKNALLFPAYPGQALPTTVYITGGYGAVSLAVENQIKALHVGDDPNAARLQVVRLSGDDRYATNKKINLDNGGQRDTVLIASGRAAYDGLALGPIAYRGAPLVLTSGTAVTDDLTDQLTAFAPKNVVIAGGTASVSTNFETELRAKGYMVSRVDGANRFETAANIARWATEGLTEKVDGTDVTDGFLNNDLGFHTDGTIIANGTGYADALSIGPVGGKSGIAILLAQSSASLGNAATTYLNAKLVGYNDLGTAVRFLSGIGGSGVMPLTLLKQAALAVQK